MIVRMPCNHDVHLPPGFTVRLGLLPEEAPVAWCPLCGSCTHSITIEDDSDLFGGYNFNGVKT